MSNPCDEPPTPVKVTFDIDEGQILQHAEKVLYKLDGLALLYNERGLGEFWTPERRDIVVTLPTNSAERCIQMLEAWVRGCSEGKAFSAFPH